MATTSTPDDKLKDYATDKQWASYVAYCEAGGVYNKAAMNIGRDQTSLRREVKTLFEKALRAGYAPDGFKVARVTTQYDKDGNAGQSSVLVKAAADPDTVVSLPDPKKIIKTSTLYAGDGTVTQQWVLEKPEDVEREKKWIEFAKELSAGIAREKPIKIGTKTSYADLLAVYPVGDHHLGMMAWGEETGDADYDMGISEDLLRSASVRLINTCPASEQALIAFLGDFLHYDSYESVTPAHRNLLDADGRYPKMVKIAVRMIRNMIAAALDRHKTVRVIFEKGNHDPSTSAFMTILLAALYENEPRVSIDTSPQHYHYYEWHSVLIGTHHGDKSKAANLPGVMASDQSAAWGRTLHRLWMTGHVHHESRKEYPGCTVESFGVLAPSDAYAAHNGYRSVRSMKALVFDKDHGEVERHSVNPRMFGPDKASAV